MRELLVRGVSWEEASRVSGILTREGFVSRAALACIPPDDFTTDYHTRIQICGLGLQNMLWEIRLRCTWLGERLYHMSVNVSHLEIMEDIFIAIYSRTTEELFASLKVSDLTEGEMRRVTARHVRQSVVELYKQLNEKMDFLKLRKQQQRLGQSEDLKADHAAVAKHVVPLEVLTPLPKTTAPADLLTF